jgi:hypothetical protein
MRRRLAVNGDMEGSQGGHGTSRVTRDADNWPPRCSRVTARCRPIPSTARGTTGQSRFRRTALFARSWFPYGDEVPIISARKRVPPSWRCRWSCRPRRPPARSPERARPLMASPAVELDSGVSNTGDIRADGAPGQASLGWGVRHRWSLTSHGFGIRPRNAEKPSRRASAGALPVQHCSSREPTTRSCWARVVPFAQRQRALYASRTTSQLRGELEPRTSPATWRAASGTGRPSASASRIWAARSA